MRGAGRHEGAAQPQLRGRPCRKRGCRQARTRRSRKGRERRSRNARKSGHSEKTRPRVGRQAPARRAAPYAATRARAEQEGEAVSAAGKLPRHPGQAEPRAYAARRCPGNAPPPAGGGQRRTGVNDSLGRVRLRTPLVFIPPKAGQRHPRGSMVFHAARVPLPVGGTKGGLEKVAEWFPATRSRLRRRAAPYEGRKPDWCPPKRVSPCPTSFFFGGGMPGRGCRGKPGGGNQSCRDRPPRSRLSARSRAHHYGAGIPAPGSGA